MLSLNTVHPYDAITGLRMLPDGSANCCVTSPPYYGLRDYGFPGQIGLEATPEEYITALIEVFREVRRVLKDDGTLWVNIGDSYAHNGAAFGSDKSTLIGRKQGDEMGMAKRFVKKGAGLKPKDIIGIPWMLAFALRADGWYLREDIIWSKPNPMPESVKDRCTRAHEYIFHLSKSAGYYHDAEAIRTKPAESSLERYSQDIDKQKGSGRAYGKTNGPMKAVGGPRKDKQRGHGRKHAGFNERWDHMSVKEQRSMGANRRSVWSISTKPFKGAHFATFPKELPRMCILAGCPEGGIVLDPFMGAATTATVTLELSRQFIGFEPNPEYREIGNKRLIKEHGLFFLPNNNNQ